MRILPFLFTCALSPVAHASSPPLQEANLQKSTVILKEQRALEVLHWWTSGSEARALETLKNQMLKKGQFWKDFAVEGLAGESAINTLHIRALSGNPPDVAQIKGPEIQVWGNAGFLTSLDFLAKSQNWNTQLPEKISEYLKVNGQYVAVPFNIHRVNWLWADPTIFKKSGADLPQTLDSFFIAAEKIKNAGYIPLALGNEPWQVATLFETIALAVLGAQDFTNAFIEGNSLILTGEKMHLTFETFRRMKQYTDSKSPGRNWSATTALVIEGKAAMQFMGDWAKGEFLAAKKKENIDFVCLPAPGTAHQFSFNIDSFVFFKNKNTHITEAQKALATMILEPEFQREFNLSKGSIPVRMDMDMKGFDACAKASMKAFLRAAKSDDLVASLSHNMAIGQPSRLALFDVISRFFNNDEISIEESMRHLRAAILADKL